MEKFIAIVFGVIMVVAIGLGVQGMTKLNSLESNYLAPKTKTDEINPVVVSQNWVSSPSVFVGEKKTQDFQKWISNSEFCYLITDGNSITVSYHSDNYEETISVKEMDITYIFANNQDGHEVLPHIDPKTRCLVNKNGLSKNIQLRLYEGGLI